MRKGNRRFASWLLALPAFLLVFTSVFSHPGHDDSLTTLKATWRGKAAIRQLVKTGTAVNDEVLDESWNNITGATTCGATPFYYLVSLENRTKGKRLFILLSHSGAFLRARFDADFAELKFTSSYPLVDCDG